MRQDVGARLVTKTLSGSMFLCIALMSGAIVGMVAQTTLRHFGLDLGSVRGDLIVDRVAQSRSALAWWAWWFVPVVAFFVGPFSVALARVLVANWWLMRGPRLLATAAFVLALAAIGQLRPAASALDIAARTGIGLLVVTLSALLAALGAQMAHSAAWRGARTPARAAAPVRRQEPARQSQAVRRRSVTPVLAAPPLRGGSANAGLPLLRYRQPHALAPGSRSIGRWARVAVAALVMIAVVSVVGGATVLVEQVAPVGIRELVASFASPVGVAGRARTLVMALLPAEEKPRAVVARVARVAPPPPVPPPIQPPEPRQRALSAEVVGYAGPAISESELTFAKGYSLRHPERLAANIALPAPTSKINATIDLKKIQVASLSITHLRRAPRHVVYSHQRIHKPSRAHNPDTVDDRHPGRTRHRARDRYGRDSYAGVEPHDRVARF
jgi:hypothetical protein